MKASSILGHEKSFDENGIDSSGKKFILTEEVVNIPNSLDIIKLIDCRPQNNNKSFYYEEVTAKKKIIIHFTMGWLKGDITALTTDHVSVPFLIGRNGRIYNLFPSKFWSYHLGPGAKGGNTPMSKECIGIELSNIGPLVKSGNNLVNTYNQNDVYCSLEETNYYVKLPNPYRTFLYYAKFTDTQYKSLAILIRFLCEKYNIPKIFVSLNSRFEIMTDVQFQQLTGIASHVNCRSDKKDIGPAFDWEKLISLV